MTAEADFLADPVDFLKKNILRVIIHGFGTQIQTFKFTEDTGMKVKKGTFHWYSKTLKYYKAEPDNAGAVRAYVLGYRDNQAVGSVLGVQPADPDIMFTYRMDGCSLGYAQAGPAAPAYVSHHNDKVNSNVATNIENQAVVFADGSNPALDFAHKSQYMTDSKGHHNNYYKSTTIGMRQPTGIWKFYLQVRKYHGQCDKDLSLKNVVEVNP